MIDDMRLKQLFDKFCRENGLHSGFIDVQKCNINNNFYEKDSNAWNKITETCGDWLHVDIDAWFKHEHPNVPKDIVINSELFSELADGDFITDLDDWVDREGILFADVEGKLYSELSEEMQGDIDNWWNELTLDDAIQSDVVSEALHIDDLEEEFGINNFVDQLGYWTTFFIPEIEDVEWAFDSNLLPFVIDDVFMLGLGGCGQDLSPLLDCYQALTDHSLPSDSKAFKAVDESYFNNVSPINAKDLIEMCKRNEPRIVFTAFGKPFGEENTYKFSFMGFTNIIALSEEEVREKFNDLFNIIEMKEIWDININDSECCESDCGFDIEAKRYFFDFMGCMQIEAPTYELALKKFNDLVASYNKFTVENVVLET